MNPDINIVSEMLNELEVQIRDFVSTTYLSNIKLASSATAVLDWEHLSGRVLGGFFNQWMAHT